MLYSNQPWEGGTYMQVIHRPNKKGKKSKVKDKPVWRPNLFVALLCILLLTFFLSAIKSALDSRALALEELGQVQTVYQQAVENNRLAQQERNQVQDADYMGQIARRDYYYSKPGEIIFQFEDKE